MPKIDDSRLDSKQPSFLTLMMDWGCCSFFFTNVVGIHREQKRAPTTTLLVVVVGVGDRADTAPGVLMPRVMYTKASNEGTSCWRMSKWRRPAYRITRILSQTSRTYCHMDRESTQAVNRGYTKRYTILSCRTWYVFYVAVRDLSENCQRLVRESTTVNDSTVVHWFCTVQDHCRSKWQ